LSDAGHESCNVRNPTPEELKELLDDCEDTLVRCDTCDDITDRKEDQDFHTKQTGHTSFSAREMHEGDEIFEHDPILEYGLETELYASWLNLSKHYYTDSEASAILWAEKKIKEDKYQNLHRLVTYTKVHGNGTLVKPRVIKYLGRGN
jgi:hypothetical protein